MKRETKKINKNINKFYHFKTYFTLFLFPKYSNIILIFMVLFSSIKRNIQDIRLSMHMFELKLKILYAFFHVNSTDKNRIKVIAKIQIF